MHKDQFFWPNLCQTSQSIHNMTCVLYPLSFFGPLSGLTIKPQVPLLSVSGGIAIRRSLVSECE